MRARLDRRLVAAGGVLVAAAAIAAAAAAFGGGSSDRALPAELRVVDLRGASAARVETKAVNAVLARPGDRASGDALVLAPVRGSCANRDDFCTVEASSVSEALRLVDARGVDVVVVSVSTPRAFRALVAAATRGRIVVRLDGAALRFPDAIGLAAASPVVDLAVPPSAAARLAPIAGRAQPPRSLRVTQSAWRSVTLRWLAPASGTPTVAYRIARDGYPAASASALGAQVTGLACGRAYDLSVQAVDARGRSSEPVTVSTRTKTCPLAVSPVGSDVNDCSVKAPCRTFDRAYHVAKPGQIVEVRAGSYPEQTLLYDPSKVGVTRPHVVFQPAPRAKVKVFGDINIADVRFTKGASHITFRNLTVMSTVNLEGCGVPDGQQCPPDRTSGSNDLTFENLRVKGGVSFLCHSCSNVKILGGVWGPDTYLPCHGSLHPEVSPTYDAQTFVKLKRPHHILIDGARFQNFARCSSSDHSECLQFEPADYVTIRNSVFTRCDTITLAFFTSLAGDSKSRAGFAAPDHIVLENNFIDHSYDASGGPTYNGLQIAECTNCVIRNNSWLQNSHLPCNRPCGEVSRNNVVVGNVGVQAECGNGGIRFSHNVFQGIACGPTDKNVSELGFVNPRKLNLHLRAGSPAIDAGDPKSFPRRDIDRQRRPVGRAPDAGADERR
jgi:hypothetical protein